MMLKSCKYCSRIHDSKVDCGRKPVREKKITNKDRFRWTKVWQNKRVEIKERDNYLCQVCIRKLYDTNNQYNYDMLEVHHAISLEDNFDKRLDNDNLITLCERHHEMAESNQIPIHEVRYIIDQQESKTYPPGY